MRLGAPFEWEWFARLSGGSPNSNLASSRCCGGDLEIYAWLGQVGPLLPEASLKDRPDAEAVELACRRPARFTPS